jgi:hypothetical protein
MIRHALLDVCPRLAPDDRTDVASGHAELSSQSYDGAFAVARQGSMSAPNLSNVVGRDLDPAHSLAADVTSLLHRVSRVLGWRAEEQVIGADTRRVVAAMADEQPIWDGTVREFPTDTRGIDAASVESAATDAAVAQRVAAASPLPAAIRRRGSVDLLPETVGNRARQVRRLVAVLQARASVGAMSCVGTLRRRTATLARARKIGRSHVTSSGSLVRGARGGCTPARPAHFTPRSAGKSLNSFTDAGAFACGVYRRS